MGNHRGARRAAPRRRSERDESSASAYVGRRIAGRDATTTPVPASAAVTRGDHQVVRPVAVELPTVFTDTTTGSLRPAVPGKRRAAKKSRTARLRGVPSLPAMVGIAALAISAGGVLNTSGTQLVDHSDARIAAPNAASGEIGTGVYDSLGRSPVLSRDSDRQALDDASEATLQQEVEAQAEQRNEALGNLAQQAEKEAKHIKLNAWVLPVDPGSYHLTAGFGDCSGLWSHCHTGLDFAGATGTPIHAIAGGTVTSTGYEGAYGNQTIITLDDGTEIWYCHQNEFAVSPGDRVVAGQVIGYIGSTGNTTGPHVHIEVRPGGGDPVDPYAALVVNGVHP
ncbi:M23 family metallopeptidase [Nocardioides sp. MH1]|uniref:M23 family metallopeptidase n=1 Tax=Nocardioides sp. MH1 TaxID=3242490 RepID=UPI003520F5A1